MDCISFCSISNSAPQASLVSYFLFDQLLSSSMEIVGNHLFTYPLYEDLFAIGLLSVVRNIENKNTL